VLLRINYNNILFLGEVKEILGGRDGLRINYPWKVKTGHLSIGFHQYANVIYRPPHPNLPPKRGERE
jgi:hypothetical protein